MLRFAFPEMTWDSAKFYLGPKKAATQKWLMNRSTEIFPGREMRYNYLQGNEEIFQENITRT